MAKEYINCPKHVFTKLWGKQNAALTFYMAARSLVTEEIPDPDNEGCKLGIILGGAKINDKMLSERLGQDERLIRHGREELESSSLILKRRYPYDYRLALRFSDKWTDKRQSKMDARFSWIDEAREAAKPRPDSPEKAVQPRPERGTTANTRVQPRSSAVEPRSDDSEPIITNDLQDPKTSLKTSTKTREKDKPVKDKTTTPSPSFSIKQVINGQEVPDPVLFIQQVAKKKCSDVSFSLKSLDALRTVCESSGLTLPEIQTAVTGRVEKMDDFQRLNAGSLLAANLLSDVYENRRQAEKNRQTEELLRATMELEQKKAEEASAAQRKAEDEESALIEDELGHPESPMKAQEAARYAQV